MIKYNARQFIFSSSATVYGDPLSLPITEDAVIGNCTNPYGYTKFFIEQILKDVVHAYPTMSVVVLRYFNPVGAHQSGLIGELPNNTPNNLMPYITQTAAMIHDRVHIFGNDYPTKDGTCIRDYIHVVDLARGHVAALEYAMHHTGIDVFNLGTGTGYSVLDIIHAFEYSTGITVPFDFVARRDGDVPVCFASTDKAHNFLRWTTEKTLFDMCIDAWRWQRHCMNEK